MKQLKSIQALRGVAALAVAFCHLIAIEQSISGRQLKLTAIADFGAYGVDLFFVISGFVMVWVAAETPRGWQSAQAFLIARCARIYPLWWIFAGLAASGYLLLYQAPWDAERIAGMHLSGPAHLLRSFTLWPQPGHPVLGAGWTLVHEMYFYLGFAVLILAIPVRFRLIAISIWGTVVFIGAMAGLSNWFAGSALALMFHPLTLQFILGAIIAYAVKRGFRRRARLALGLGVLLLAIDVTRLDIALCHEISELFIARPMTAETLPWRRTFLIGGAAGALVYGLVCLEHDPARGLIIPGFFTRIGDWSYSLYLCHMLTISVAGRAIYVVMYPTGPWAIAAFLTVATGLTLATAWLSYQFVERPLIAFFKRHRGAPSKPHKSTQVPA